jgi:hypothetical protein
MLLEYKLLLAKERDLIHKIKEYENAAPEMLYVDRVVEMKTPKNQC